MEKKKHCKNIHPTTETSRPAKDTWNL